MSTNIKPKLLIIEDDEDLADVLKSHFKTRDFEIEVRYDALGPLARMRKLDGRSPWDIILTDLKMPGMNGIEFIHEVHALAPNLPVILMTAHGGVETAVQAVKEGAYDFVMKPLNFAELAISMERALRHRNLTEENQVLRAVIQETKDGSTMIAKSAGMKAITDLVRRVAKSTATILITGESGVGKEVVARAIHQAGDRREKAFVAINCAAIPETLLESELFGFAKGAFTGAIEKKLGLFEEAEGGTLFLDEVGDLSGALQAKLLRVLQEKKIKRIGENHQRAVDVRIIAATHKNLADEVREQRFREDLFFRLNVIPIRIPPLRERRDDIGPLAEHFLKKFVISNRSKCSGFSKDALEFLSQNPWPGNVRELENAIERAVVLCESEKITARDFLVFSDHETKIVPTISSNPQNIQALFTDTADDRLPTLQEWELRYIQFVVERVGGVRERARKILDIDRKTLYKKMDQYSEPSLDSRNLSNRSSVDLTAPSS